MSDAGDEKPTIDSEGWRLVSAEERSQAYPGFSLPSVETRRTVRLGQAVQLLFEITTRQYGRIIDHGVDRMWVIVKCRSGGRYTGVLDNDPGYSENLRLRAGDVIAFGPEHIIDVTDPPPDYVLAKYGAGFFEGVEDGG